jgi:hypothetical protein
MIWELVFTVVTASGRTSQTENRLLYPGTTCTVGRANENCVELKVPNLSRVQGVVEWGEKVCSYKQVSGGRKITVDGIDIDVSREVGSDPVSVPLERISTVQFCKIKEGVRNAADVSMVVRPLELKVCSTQMGSQGVARLKTLVEALGRSAALEADVRCANLLVAAAQHKTPKFLYALATMLPIVTLDWLEAVA